MYLSVYHKTFETVYIYNVSFLGNHKMKINIKLIIIFIIKNTFLSAFLLYEEFIQ